MQYYRYAGIKKDRPYRSVFSIRKKPLTRKRTFQAIFNQFALVLYNFSEQKVHGKIILLPVSASAASTRITEGIRSISSLR